MAQTVADIIAHLSELPPFPKVTARLLSLLGDATVSFEELADVIGQSPSLAMKVIKIANSPFYMASRPITSVKDAAFILGLTTIKSLTAGVSIQEGLSTFVPRTVQFDQASLWEHSYATAIAASTMATKKSLSADKLYLAGLIHDTGKLIMAHFWPETFKRIVNHLRQEEGSFAGTERRFFSHSHAEIAATLCYNWQFPPDIVALVERHHADLEDPEPVTEELKVIRAADTIVTASGHAFPQGCGPERIPDDIAPYAKLLRNFDVSLKKQLATLEL